MYTLRFLSLLLVVLFAAPACANKSGTAGTVMYFQEKQGGGESFATRMLLTPEYLRMDYGKDDDDFVLFDRSKRAIYSVNRADKTVLVVQARPITTVPPQPFEQTVKKDTEAYPPVAGKAIDHYQLFTNHTRCYDVFAAPGLLPEAVQALREFAQTLAGEQATSLAYTPKEMQSACELANNVFLPARHLDFGFPVRQEDMAGNVRQLVNYEERRPLAPALFQLPADFRRYHPGDMRS